MKKTLLILVSAFTFAMSIQAQDVNASIKDTDLAQDIKVKLKEGVEQAVIIDGKKYDSDIFNLLDLDKIETITILKGEEAIRKYGEANVVVLTTKKDIVIRSMKFTINEDDDSKEIEAKKEKVKKRLTLNSLNFDNMKGPNAPIFVVDGKVWDGTEFNEILHVDIKNIKVLKGAAATEKYGARAVNGAVIITTKNK